MSVTNQFIAAIGTGTLQSSTGSTNVAVVPHANTRRGDLLVLLVYATGGDLTVAVDAGDGWQVLSSGYDSANSVGILLAAMVANQDGAGSYAGLTLPASMAYTAHVATYALGYSGSPVALRFLEEFGVDQVGRDNGWTFLSATGTALDAPGISFPYAQCVELVGRGYNNAGTTTTVGTITGFTETFDTGQASPPHGIVLSIAQWARFGINTFISNGSIYRGTVTSNIAVTKTMRCGIRACIPILLNINGKSRHRQMQSRRVA